MCPSFVIWNRQSWSLPGLSPRAGVGPSLPVPKLSDTGIVTNTCPKAQALVQLSKLRFLTLNKTPQALLCDVWTLSGNCNQRTRVQPMAQRQETRTHSDKGLQMLLMRQPLISTAVTEWESDQDWERVLRHRAEAFRGHGKEFKDV